MQVRYSHHARERMTEQGIAQTMVDAVLATPEHRTLGETAHEYRAPPAGQGARCRVTPAAQLARLPNLQQS